MRSGYVAKDKMNELITKYKEQRSIVDDHNITKLPGLSCGHYL